MNGLWLKVKVWLKVAGFAFLFIYLLVFFVQNTDNQAKFWYWYNREPETGTLYLVLLSFFAGVIATILVRTTFKTIRQIREVRQRSRTDRLEREVADMKSKAGRLRTKNGPATSPTAGE
jgi:uncharacterized integral membrane protein